MHRLVARILVLASLLVLASPAKAVDSPISLLSFQANGIRVSDPVNTSYSGQVAWIPSLGFGGVGLRGELGITMLKNVINENFFATNYELFLTLPIIPGVFTLEGGGGLSTWMGGNGGTHPIASGYVVTGIPGGINRIFFGYSRFLPSGANANEFKLGLGFSL